MLHNTVAPTWKICFHWKNSCHTWCNPEQICQTCFCYTWSDHDHIGLILLFCEK